MTNTPRQGGPSLLVLVVDDSAVVRRILASVLSGGGMVVETASDPLIAMRKVRHQRPDVIVLDIEMPRMDGITFLRNIMADDPIPVVICSGHAGRGTKTAIDALSHGAVDIVTKPEFGVRDFLQGSAHRLLDSVKAAAGAKLRRRYSPSIPGLPAQPPAGTPTGDRSAAGPAGRIMAIGTSTGGPEALRTVLGGFPADGPATLVVQHMPGPFLRAFSERLDESSAMRIRLAENGDVVERGTVLVAPGDCHMTLVRRGLGHAVRLSNGPLVSRHRPSVDVLFRSVAQVAAADAVGIVMTGMGKDGVDGLLEMRQRGATTIAQDEASCVVYGMPREAVERDAVDHVVPLHGIASFALEAARQIERRGGVDASRR